MKKQERMENKKRKAAALLSLLNEKESQQSSTNSNNSTNDESERMMKEEPVEKKVKIVEELEYSDIRKKLNDKKNPQRHMPRFVLKSSGEKASLDTTHSLRMPLMLEDIQHLLMTSLLGSGSPYKPERWCILEKANKITHTVVLVIEGLTSYNFLSNESMFGKTKEIFDSPLEIVMPNYAKNQIIEELSSVPLTQSLKNILIKTYGSLEAAVSMNRDHHLITKSIFSINKDAKIDDNLPPCENENFSRTRLLLSPLQMMIENYPMPLRGEFESKFKHFRCTKTSYDPVTPQSPMFGLDCEMCRTTHAENELARVSIVDEDFNSVYESLVRPDNPIVDYLTPWSGITKEMMEKVTKTLTQVQNEVCSLLPADAILVGQSLNCDLRAMKLMHPYVIDTSCIFNITGDRNRKSKLQFLAKTFLGEEIQMNKEGHSSIEDSTASLKLTKLKLSKDIYFGDAALQTRRNVHERRNETGISKGINETQVKTSMLSHAAKNAKKSAIITTDSYDLNLQKIYARSQPQVLKDSAGDDAVKELPGVQHIKESCIRDVVKKAEEIALDHDFNMLHFNILEDPLYREEPTSSGKLADDKVQEIIPKIDKWINKVWKKVASKGLFVVLFGGHETNNNGLTMIRVKN